MSTSRLLFATAAAMPAPIVAFGEVRVPGFESLPPPAGGATKIELLSSPSMPSQFASTSERSGRSVVEVEVHEYSQPFDAMPSRSKKPGMQPAIPHTPAVHTGMEFAPAVQGLLQPPQCIS